MSGRVVRVELAGWEIECCVPPPGVGDRVRWPLTFHGGELDPAGFDRPAVVVAWWGVEHRADGTAFLHDGPVVAVWSEYRLPAPPPGVREEAGVLTTTLHGGRHPADLPAVTGRVRRVWVTGAAGLREVPRAPRWFASRPGPADAPRRSETGLLVELAVDGEPVR